MNFTVYKSSAGSGKTFTLVREYLKLALLHPDKFRHVLAITFTNKAANEMKQRIISGLSLLAEFDAGNPEDPGRSIMVAIMEDTSWTMAEIIEKSKIILRKILHMYSEFAVSTIDSFVHRIVRTFARDLLLPVNFEIELDAANLIKQAVDALINKIGVDEDLTRVLVLYSLSRAEDDKSWNIERDLEKFAGLLFNEDGHNNIERLKDIPISTFFEIHARLQKSIKIFENSVRDYGNKGLHVIESHQIDPSAFASGSTGIHGYFNFLSQFRDDKLIPNSRVQNTIDNDKWYAAKATPDEKAKIDQAKNQLKKLFLEASGFVENGISDYFIHATVLANIYKLSVLNEIGRLLKEISRDQNLVHIAEFNRTISEIIADEPAPYIYERIGEKYHSFLVDEFQDTSLLQWQNLIPLIDNALAQGSKNIVVGDGKQAIYRWRNGEVEQFAALPLIHKRKDNLLNIQQENALVRNYKEHNLGINYRTRKEIVDFNNMFFRTLAERLTPPLDRIYENLEQKSLDSKPDGYLDFRFYDKNNSILDFSEYNLHQIVSQVEECLFDGYQLKDIAILFRSNKNANFIARELISRGYEIQSNESVMLANSKVVNFIIACLKIIANPDDEISRAVFRHFTGDITLLKNNPINELSSSLEQLPIFEICEAIIRKYRLFENHNAYLVFFMDVVHDYNISKGSSLNGFLDWWDQNKEKQYLALPQGLNAIRIMTIHKAKGLEFPIVILPFANYEISNTNNLIWVDLKETLIPEIPVALVSMNKDLDNTKYALQYREEVSKNTLDYLNLLYVAFTRPIDRLYVITEIPSKNSKSTATLQSQLLDYFSNIGKDILEGCVTIGTKPAIRIKADDSLDQSVLETIIDSDWRDKLIIRLNAPGDWQVDDPEQKRGRGNVLHEFLAQLNNTSDDVKELIAEISHSKGFSEEERKYFSEAIQTVLAHDDLQEFYMGEIDVLNEMDILLPDGKLLRPDRVVVKDNIASIIDYKTGSYDTHHEEQLKGYAGILEKMGYNIGKMLLVYFEDPLKVVEVK